MKPYFFGWLKSATALCWKWIMCSTPARFAFSLAALITSPSMSYPWISTFTVVSIISSASFTHSYQSLRSIRFVHSSAVKSRFIPGATFAAIIAASIGKVPLPQNGSTRIRSFLQGVNIIKEAARVSVNGALLVIVLYPRLCKESPDVSSATVTSSFSKKIRTG